MIALLSHWMPPIAWMGLIFFLSSQSSLPLPQGFAGKITSYLAHFLVYGVLTVLYYRSLIPTGIPRNRGIYAIALSAVYGITDEIHQSFVPNRTPSLVDLGVDVLGSLIFLSLIALARRQGYIFKN